jgi:hypothetical protein
MGMGGLLIEKKKYFSLPPVIKTDVSEVRKRIRFFIIKGVKDIQ